jgi:serine-type D-Ala-D-Ala carboxypeptidase (penicillin-binding protein 5/6)
MVDRKFINRVALWAGVALVALSAAALTLRPPFSGPHPAAAPVPRAAAASTRQSVATRPSVAFAADWLARHPAPALDIHAESALVVDVDAHQVLWRRDDRSPRPPASLTKMVTAVVAADLAPLDTLVTVPAEATASDGTWTMMGLTPGEQLTVRELLYGMLMLSGNDAAETLAGAFVSRSHFVRLMNEMAAELGMRDTHFTNPSGLDDPRLRTTAFDLAIAGATIATRYPEVLAVAGTRTLVLPATAGHREYEMRSLIGLISTYPGATGLKTGYTDDAGYCLVATAARDGRHLVAVVMHSDLALTTDATRLLDYGFGVSP